SSDPCVGFSEECDVCTARRKSAFVLQRSRQIRRWHSRPNTPAVARRHDVELTIDGVAENDAVVCIPKRHRVEKCFRIFILELQRPALSGIGRFINPGSWSITDAEREGSLFIERIDIT